MRSAGHVGATAGVCRAPGISIRSGKRRSDCLSQGISARPPVLVGSCRCAPISYPSVRCRFGCSPQPDHGTLERSTTPLTATRSRSSISWMPSRAALADQVLCTFRGFRICSREQSFARSICSRPHWGCRRRRRPLDDLIEGLPIVGKTRLPSRQTRGRRPRRHPQCGLLHMLLANDC